MSRIDYDKLYNEWDWSEYLLQPIGVFSKDDVKLILETITNVKGIATLANVIGLRTTMSKELMLLKDDSDWKQKAHYLKEGEAVEMFVRLSIIDHLDKWCNQPE